MKKIIIKSFDKIVILLLGFSGIFYSCAMYGTPEADYEIKGIVTDKSNAKPIKNIQIVHQMYRDTTYTDAEGKYAFIYNRNLFDHLNLIVEDIDGEANGGEFETQEIDVIITQAERVKKGRGAWDWGKYVKTQNIELERKDVVIPMYGTPVAPFKP